MREVFHFFCLFSLTKICFWSLQIWWVWVLVPCKINFWNPSLQKILHGWISNFFLPGTKIQTCHICRDQKHILAKNCPTILDLLQFLSRIWQIYPYKCFLWSPCKKCVSVAKKNWKKEQVSLTSNGLTAIANRMVSHN